MSRPTVLITGGAGFVGSNLADRLLTGGSDVVIYDSLKRPRVTENIAWLKRRHRDRVSIEIADVRDAARLAAAVGRADQVFHFAAQVAVTTSVENPSEDFEVNARGTLNLLEAVRQSATRPPVVFASTNKVYGKLASLDMVGTERRYHPADETARIYGIDETQPLELYSPYGCSKGSADQYVLDYARIYGLKTAVFRMSCLYGPRQFGTEDQGWVAHFLISALVDRPITLYGDGRQVRDVLFVDDVVDAFLLAQEKMPQVAGRVFNIGGGPDNAVSLLELLQLIEHFHGRRVPVSFDGWRPGDQHWYVSDTRRFQAATGWRPKVPVQAGVQRLLDWLRGHYASDSADRAVVA